MLCREIIAVCPEIHTKHINTLCGQNGILMVHNVNTVVTQKGMIKNKFVKNINPSKL
jgi:hypothetical protein